MTVWSMVRVASQRPSSDSAIAADAKRPEITAVKPRTILAKPFMEISLSGVS
jgi:hypothetical protein